LDRQIHFHVTDIRYGSMTFPVDITGVQALIELFQQNYDVFHGFLEMYVPGAICLAAGLGPADFVPWAVEIDDEAFRARFADARSRLDATGKGRIPFGSTFGAWAITNFTLVVPVALATLLLYWALVATGNERERLVKSWEILANEHRMAMADERTRVVKLVESQEKVATTLISSAWKATGDERERLVKSWEALANEHRMVLADERTRVVKLVESQEKVATTLISSAWDRKCCVAHVAPSSTRRQQCQPVRVQPAAAATKE
jgi:hypothetical protein